VPSRDGAGEKERRYPESGAGGFGKNVNFTFDVRRHSNGFEEVDEFSSNISFDRLYEYGLWDCKFR
jgi:hypothetical protein